MSEREILPCPFCGMEGISEDGLEQLTIGFGSNGFYFVVCGYGCTARGPARYTKDRAIAAWNAAPRDTCADVPRDDAVAEGRGEGRETIYFREG